MLRTIDVSIT